jgi:hypothetical protein
VLLTLLTGAKEVLVDVMATLQLKHTTPAPLLHYAYH